MTWGRRNPVSAQEIVGGDVGYLVTVRADMHEGRCSWVDVEIHAITGREMDGTPLYGDVVDMQRDPLAVEPDIHGFVKWDGCTQLDTGDLHVDSGDELEAWLAAIRRAREMAGALLTGWDG